MARRQATDEIVNKKLRIDIVEETLANLNAEIASLKAENERLKVMIMDLMTKKEDELKEVKDAIASSARKQFVNTYEMIDNTNKPKIEKDKRTIVYS